MQWILIGGGGHARAVADILKLRGQAVSGYVAHEETPGSPWPYLGDDHNARLPKEAFIALGMGGVTPGGLARRMEVFHHHLDKGQAAPPVISPHATLAGSADIDVGVTVMMGVSIQAAAKVGPGAIINTGAIVEHDCVIGEGAHIAPGAIILGGCHIGRCAMVGAGAIILPGAHVAENALVAAGTRLSAD